jgi:hypothetical protein
VFGEELELPYYAAFHPLESCKGMAELYKHFFTDRLGSVETDSIYSIAPKKKMLRTIA